MELTIREPDLEEHLAGARLLRSCLGFSERDAVPAWLMHATAEAGGLALGAFAADGTLVGWSFAVAARSEGRDELLSCGLAVACPHRSEGIGRALKLAQRSAALERGVERIRWTADPLAAPALRLYLSHLGARLTGYRAGLYDPIRDGHPEGQPDGLRLPQDDVEVVWDLRESERTRVGTDPPVRVELPFRRADLSPPEHLDWRLSVRDRLRRVLAEGRIGVGVDLDATARRCWLVLAVDGPGA